LGVKGVGKVGIGIGIAQVPVVIVWFQNLRIDGGAGRWLAGLLPSALFCFSQCGGTWVLTESTN